jgi:hypothetical protein
MKRKSVYIASIVLVSVGIAGFASAERTPHKGRIPERAFVNGGVRAELVPDFIVAYGQDGEVVGYVRKNDVFETEGRHHEGSILVLDESLSRPVGRMVPGRGFVPTGVPDSQAHLYAPNAEDNED